MDRFLKDWQLASKSHDTYYTNIAGGTYYLRLEPATKAATERKAFLNLKLW